MQAVPPAFNTREFRQSDGPGQHNAASAWAQGATGQAVTIAVIDTGIDPDNPEFAGRLSPASIDIVADRGLEAPDDHGTLVSLVAAAARDDTGIQGIAFDATILAIRADSVGSCQENGASSDLTCSFFDEDIAAGIDHAVANGAKVINISLGGSDGISAQLRTSVINAVDAGVLIVVASGNDGMDELDGFGRQLAAAGDGGLIIVGSVDEDYSVSDFTNRAGQDADRFLSARGSSICCVYQDGQLFVDDEGFVFLFSGTSFASPQVAGAAALLAQAFPHLTGRQIAEILLETAFDAGAAGADPVFGRGILDIAAAFRPLGATAIAGQNVGLALADSTLVGSPAMGDALGTASLPTLVTDRYQRAFETDLGGTVRSAELRPRLHGAVGGQTRSLSGGVGGASLAFTIDDRGPQPLQLTRTEAETARVLAAQVALHLAPETQLAFGYRQSADGVVAGLQGQDRPAFMIAASPRGDSGGLKSHDAAIAVRQQIGPWGLTVSAESGSTYTAATVRHAALLRGQRLDENVASFGLALDRRLGTLETAFGLTWLAEEQTVLGARFHEGFGLAGSDTLFADADIGWRIDPHWRLGASWRHGFTSLRDAPLVGEGSRLTSYGWSMDVERRGFLASDDTLALRLSQPLRVSDGGLNLLLPSSFSYETLQPDAYTIRTLSLSPDGRELTGELAWRGRLLYGFGGASLFYRHQPGHFARQPADIGVAVRWSRAF